NVDARAHELADRVLANRRHGAGQPIARGTKLEKHLTLAGKLEDRRIARREDAMTDALRPQLFDRHAHLRGSLRHVVFATVRGEAQPGKPGLLNQRRETTQLEADVAIRKVQP